MKRSVALLVAVAFGIGAAGMAAAQTTTTAPAPAQSSAPAPATTPAPAQKPADMKQKSAEMKKTKNAQGVVKSASADSLVVAGKEKAQGTKEMKDAEWTFAVDAKTKIKKAGKDVAVADLKPGDSVQVRYMDHEGKTVAQSISVRGGSAAKK